MPRNNVEESCPHLLAERNCRQVSLLRRRAWLVATNSRQLQNLTTRPMSDHPLLYRVVGIIPELYQALARWRRVWPQSRPRDCDQPTHQSPLAQSPTNRSGPVRPMQSRISSRVSPIGPQGKFFSRQMPCPGTGEWRPGSYQWMMPYLVKVLCSMN